MELRKYQKEFRMRLVKEKPQKVLKSKEYFIELIQSKIQKHLNAEVIEFSMFCDDYEQLEDMWNDVPEFVNCKYILEADTSICLMSNPPKYWVYLRKG